jgi:hypothetical protein
MFSAMCLFTSPSKESPSEETGPARAGAHIRRGGVVDVATLGSGPTGCHHLVLEDALDFLKLKIEVKNLVTKRCSKTHWIF